VTYSDPIEPVPGNENAGPRGTRNPGTRNFDMTNFLPVLAAFITAALDRVRADGLFPAAVAR
jgi:hypothetical protein